LSKKVVFFALSGNKNLTTFGSPMDKIRKKSPSGLPWKNPSEALA